MGKHALISAVLSLVVIGLLPLHSYLVELMGDPDLVNMAVGLPIGLVTAVNIDIVRNKIRRQK